jgi:hypothetical protein
MIIDEAESTRNTFTGRLAQLIDGRWPQASAADAKAADAALNVAYRKALAFLASKDNLTTVKPGCEQGPARLDRLSRRLRRLRLDRRP